MFIGRKLELAELRQLQNKRTSSLVCIMGRRRIGKSSLIKEFSKNFTHYIEIQGLGPSEGGSLREQLDHFSDELSKCTGNRQVHFKNWNAALTALAEASKHGKYLIMLDEISWMARGDPLFPSRLKSAWDTQLKHNPKLILVVCGSVSSWISDNILKSANFEGRISLQIRLIGLSLQEINKFWESNNYRFSLWEKILILSITGGVPKYLEELSQIEGGESSIFDMCFAPNKILFNDYEKIFQEIFGRRTKTLEKIVRLCLYKKYGLAELAGKLKIEQSGELTSLIEILELSGFMARDYYFNPEGKVSKLSHLRVSDNYLRFYLKYIEPEKARILKGGKAIKSSYDLQNFDSMLGLQFENLVLANREQLYAPLDLTMQKIISAAPHVQRKGTLNKGGCQIDLLIHTTLDVFFLCEIKGKKVIDASVIKEVKKKMEILSVPKRTAVKPVLVYAGALAEVAEDEIRRFFYKVVSVEELFVGG